MLYVPQFHALTSKAAIAARPFIENRPLPPTAEKTTASIQRRDDSSAAPLSRLAPQ
jgi:hypothetical protein